jgi:predicted alpha/beta superfamily hydrolase
MKTTWMAALLAAALLPGCTGPVAAETAERGEGLPYELKDTQVWTVPDPATGRSYQLFVSLPASYAADPSRRYPVMYVADADYGFPLIRSISRRINLEGPAIEEFILIGLSYAKGENGMTSRRRDYTPTANAPASVPKDQVHGQAWAYQYYLKKSVLPFVDARFRTDPARRIFMGHSYGALLGTGILFSDPTLFHDYILGSPSLWYDDRYMLRVEEDYARTHKDLPANIFMYVGAFEAVRPGDPRYNRKDDMVADMTAFETQLKSRHYPGLTIASRVLPEENHLTVFPPGFTRALQQVLPAR